MKKTKLLSAMALLAGGVFVSFVSTSTPAVQAPEKPCYCPDVYDPVCIIETGQMFSNACQAGCAGYTPDEYAECYF